MWQAHCMRALHNDKHRHHQHNQIENILIGAPAALSKRFEKGDAITHIDGKEVNKKNIIQLLVGNDMPGKSEIETLHPTPNTIHPTP